jgi:hypothetical protein
MIAENDFVPVCKQHDKKITVCLPCQKLIAGFSDSMPKKEPMPWGRESEPLADFHWRDQKVNEENQARLHSWAVANVYVDALEDVEVTW